MDRFVGIDVGAETVKVAELIREPGGLRCGGRALVAHDKDPGRALLDVLSGWDWDGVQGAAVSGRLGRQVALTRVPGKQALLAGGYSKKVDALAKDVEATGEEGLKAGAAGLKTALDAKDRKAIGEAAGKLEKAVKDVKDKDLGKKADKLAKDTKGDATNTFGKVFSGQNLLRMLYLLIGFWIFALIGILIMGMPAGKFTAGFPFVFILSLIAAIIGGNSTISYYGLEVVFWALIIGLLVSNTIGVPGWLKEAVKTEYFIKIGLVLLGAEILFTTIVKVGAYGMVQSIIVIALVFYFCFWVAKKLGLESMNLHPFWELLFPSAASRLPLPQEVRSRAIPRR